MIETTVAAGIAAKASYDVGRTSYRRRSDPRADGRRRRSDHLGVDTNESDDDELERRS